MTLKILFLITKVNLFDDLLSGDENIFFNNTAKKSQNNISNVKNLKNNRKCVMSCVMNKSCKNIFKK